MGLLRLGDLQKPINPSLFDSYRYLIEGQSLRPSEVASFIPSARNIVQADLAIETTTETTIIQVGTNRKILVNDLQIIFKLTGAVGSGVRVRLTDSNDVKLTDIYEVDSGAFNPGTITTNVVSVKFPFFMENGQKLRGNGLKTGDTLFVNVLGQFT